MKKRVLFVALGLFLLLSGFNIANPPVPNDKNKQAEKECDCEYQEQMHKDWHAKMVEREKNLLSWVDQYTPDKKDEWTRVLEEKKTLRNKWLSPEFAQKREQWKQEKMEKIKQLKKQLEEGKITKEEFVKKAHGEKGMGHWKTYPELKAAVAAKDDKQAATLLNQMLDQYKMHNEKMLEMINGK